MCNSTRHEVFTSWKDSLFQAAWVLAYQRSLILCMTIVLSMSRELRILLDCAVYRRCFLPCRSRFSIEINSNSKFVTSHAAQPLYIYFTTSQITHYWCISLRLCTSNFIPWTVLLSLFLQQNLKRRLRLEYWQDSGWLLLGKVWVGSKVTMHYCACVSIATSAGTMLLWNYTY